MSARFGLKDQYGGSDSTATRLARLLQAKACIIYHEDIPDPEFPQIRCSIYGAPKTNELFVKLTNGVSTFVESVQSELAFPLMADRIFGLDVADHQTAFGLAERMWVKYRETLVIKSQASKQS